LSVAASGGDSQIIALLLANGAGIDATDRNGRTPLMRAVEAGHLGAARVLLQHGANVNYQVNRENYFGQTVLHTAVSQPPADTRMLRLLLKYGAAPETRDQSGQTVLAAAAWAQPLPIIRLLLDLGANPDPAATNLVDSPLFPAAWNARWDVLDLLLSRGSRPERIVPRLVPKLHWAVVSNDRRAVLGCFRDGTINERDRNGCTALFWAAQTGRQAMVRLLLEKGADPNLVDGRRQTSLHAACAHGTPQIVRWLLMAGAQLEAIDQDGRPPSWRAIAADRPDILQVLLGSGLDVNMRYAHGVTLLHQAAVWNRLRCVKFLVRHGAEVNARDERGDTPLHGAVFVRNAVMVEFLCRHGAPPPRT